MAVRRTNLYRDIGDTGLNQTGWGEIGDEFLREWQGAGEKARRVREMLYNSPVIGALRMAVEMPIRDIDWHFVSDEGDEDPRLVLLNDALDAMSHSWEDHITDALAFLWYGWSMFTVTYQQVNGRVLWKKFRPLAPDTLMKWNFSDDGGMAGIEQWPHLWSEPIPIERMVVYRFRRARGNPEGESLLRPAWPAWFYVKNLQQIEAIGIERNLAGLPVMRLPEGADTTDSDDPTTDVGRARRIVRNVRADEMGGLVLPWGWDFSLVASSGSGKVADTDIAIQRYNKQMLMAALSQFLALGMDNVGALATFEAAGDFFTLTLNAVADTIAETFTKFAAERLLLLNGLDPTGVRLEHSPAGNVQPAAVADALTKLVSAGAVTLTSEDEVWLRSLLRLPARDVEAIDADRDMARQEAAERADAMRDALAGRQEPAAGDDEDDEDLSADVAAEYYATGGNDAYRARMERQWQRKMAAFLQRQGRDVTRQAKRDYAAPK
jgi:hypothetical protein